MKEIEVDVAVEDVEVFFKEVKKEYNIDGILVNERSPAGGWPVVKLSGDEGDINSFIKDNGYEGL